MNCLPLHHPDHHHINSPPISHTNADESAGSYDDIMNLISEAKAVSASIDEGLKDMRVGFVGDDDMDDNDSKLDNHHKPIIKKVRFAKGRKIVHYIHTTPCSSYKDDEQAGFLHQMHDDLMAYEAGREDSDAFTSRGLERRTPRGQAQRTKWRQHVRTAVLDEQDRQWNVLPLDVPCDQDAIADISLHSTRGARELARQVGLEDYRDVYGSCGAALKEESQATLGMDGSWNTLDASANLESSLSSLFQDDCDTVCAVNNSKGHAVHWPTRFHQVHYYEPEEDTSYPPYTSLAQAKAQWQNEIDHLDGEEHTDIDQDSLRGLECRTATAEHAFQALRLELTMVVYTPHLENDPLKLARQCQKVSARARKEARTRGLMDQRAVKVYLREGKKKLITRVPSFGDKSEGRGVRLVTPTSRTPSPTTTPEAEVATTTSPARSLIQSQEHIDHEFTALQELFCVDHTRRESLDTVTTAASSLCEEEDIEEPFSSFTWPNVMTPSRRSLSLPSNGVLDASLGCSVLDEEQRGHTLTDATSTSFKALERVEEVEDETDRSEDDCLMPTMLAGLANDDGLEEDDLDWGCFWGQQQQRGRLVES